MNFIPIYSRTVKNYIGSPDGTYFIAVPMDLQILLGMYLLCPSSDDFCKSMYRNPKLYIQLKHISDNCKKTFTIFMKEKNIKSIKNLFHDVIENSPTTIFCESFRVAFKFVYECENYIKVFVTINWSNIRYIEPIIETSEYKLYLSPELFDTLTVVLNNIH